MFVWNADLIVTSASLATSFSRSVSDGTTDRLFGLSSETESCITIDLDSSGLVNTGDLVFYLGKTV